ncbi:unnamed protein product, partial [Nesidiocoris tenuis]
MEYLPIPFFSNVVKFIKFLALALDEIRSTDRFSGGSMMPEEEKKPVFLSTMVGDTVIFSCDLDFPQDVVVPYTLNWNKE